jgi:transposase
MKVHNMAEGGALQALIAEKCDIGVRSVQRVLAEPEPTREEVIAECREDAARMGRPPKADGAMIERIRALLEEKPKLPAIEVLRLSREWGYTGGRSQMSALVKKLRPAPRKEPVVRFEGLPGEYTQFDFGECEVNFTATGPARIQFFAARLKFSRFMHVELVADQVAETLVRAILVCLAVFGGSSKEWVFDNPKTIRISKFGVVPILLHRYLAQLVAEYRVIPTLCARRAGNQKGSVERLVGFVKNSFLRVRTFRDLEDLRIQLAEWLREVNFDRPCDATGVIPAVALAEEAPLLAKRPLQCSAREWSIQDSATVTPMGTVPYVGTSYSATATNLGAPATLLVRGDEIEIHVCGKKCVHVREDHTGEVRRLPEHREDVLDVLHGRRKIATFRRQCLLELGAAAWQFLGVLVHECPNGRWEEPCTALYELLCMHGDAALLAAFADCVAQKRFTVDAVDAALLAAA